MNNSVIIKGNKYGMIVVLDKNIPYSQLKADIVSKFTESAQFFKNAKMAVAFEGRTLTTDEEKEIIDLITENTTLQIVCVIDNDAEREEYFKKSVQDKLYELSGNSGEFYRGTLRSGMEYSSETSIVVLGDVNPGAKLISKGNVIVLGSLKGTVYAGGGGDTSAFVVALEMNPMQIKIGDIIARSGDSARKKQQNDAKIAYATNGSIYIEPLSKNVLREINYN